MNGGVGSIPGGGAEIPHSVLQASSPKQHRTNLWLLQGEGEGEEYIRSL